MADQPNFDEAWTEFKAVLLAELEPYLMPILEWLARFLKRIA